MVAIGLEPCLVAIGFKPGLLGIGLEPGLVGMGPGLVALPDACDMLRAIERPPS